MGKRLHRLASCETFLPFPFAIPCYLSQGPSVKRCGRQCWTCRHDPVCICSTSSLPWRLHSPPSSLTASPKPVDSAGVPKGQLPGHYPGVIHALCCLETPVNEESLMSGQGQGVPLSCLKGAIQLSTGQEGLDVLRAPRSAFTFHCFCDGSGVMQCVLDQALPTCICRQLSTMSNFHSSENMETLVLVYFTWQCQKKKKEGRRRHSPFMTSRPGFFVCLF